MDAAYRSLVAFWIGGAEATPETPAGYGSMLAFWVGGVGWPARPAPVSEGKGKAGGKWVLPAAYRAAVIEEYSQSLLNVQRNAAVRQEIEKRVLLSSWLRKIEADHQQKCLEWAAFTVVLTEI